MYGTEYTKEDIDRAIRGEITIETTDEIGHGSELASVAAGSSLAEDLGVSQEEAKLACGALYCLGGTVAVHRAVSASGADLSSKAICGAMERMGYAGNVILDVLN